MFGNDTVERDVGALIVAGPGEAPLAEIAPGSSLITARNGIVTAQRVAVPRDNGRVLQQIGLLAPVAGTDWYYSIPFRDNRNNRTTYVEGLSIKGAMEVVRIFGNCQVDCVVEDVQHSWIFHARFTDYETGFTLSRPFQARKSAADKAMKDRERALDIAFQIGASKAMRNVVTNALQSFCAHAFESAKRSLVDRIEKDVERYRAIAADALNVNDIEIARVERVRGKPFKDWNARDLALISGEMSSIKDGMATWDEVYPPLEEQITADPAEEGTREEAPAARRRKKPEADKAAAGTGEPKADEQQQDRQQGQAAAGTKQAGAGAEPAAEEQDEEQDREEGDWDAWLDTFGDDLDHRGNVIDVNSFYDDQEAVLAKAPEGIQNRARALRDARLAELRGEQG